MDGRVRVTLPKLGESILSATVVQWFKKVGERVERDEPLLEVSTDKVNSEIPSPVGGILEQIVALPEQELEVGGLLALIATEGVAPSKEAVLPSKPADTTSSSSGEQEAFLSPAVLRLLHEKKIPLSEIHKIPRSGEGGRLTRKDVENYALPKCPASKPLPSSVSSEDTERVKMSSLRKAIADNMVKSFYEAPHASLMIEVDVTHLVERIAEKKGSFLEKYKVKLTITPFVAHAIAKALGAYPLLNASLEGETIVMKKAVHLGIAVSVDQGVMVPVVRQCHALSLPKLAEQITLLADKARTHRLSPEEVRGGTITMTNFGMTGVLMGIPIIRYPEVAIVGLGAITKKVCPMPDHSIAIRSTMMISLTFDHRVLDGLYGCGFLAELKKELEDKRQDDEIFASL
jgi:2-oxoglutarate dehydrogenase E2 component (dihydrolipoamide succinyltransferase)